MTLYLTLKWLHLLAIISWMAGVLYLFRLFVNHAENRDSEDNHTLLSGMEYRLVKYITVPAMVVAWGAGLGMFASNPMLVSQGWFPLKLLVVIALTAWTGYGAKLSKLFADQTNPVPSSKTLRYMNEVPTLLMMIIVALVVFRPFIG